MVFSSLSIIISVVTFVSQGQIVRSQDYASIEFDVTGNSIMVNKKKCRNRIQSIQSGISSLLGLDESLLEVMRPMTIKKGLKVNINIFINNAASIDMNIENDINKAQRSGEMADIIKTAWDLGSVPIISNVKYQKHDSWERRQNTVIIGSISEMTLSSKHQLKIDAMPAMDMVNSNSIANSNIDEDEEKQEVLVLKENVNDKRMDYDFELPKRISSVKTPGEFINRQGTEYSTDSTVKRIPSKVGYNSELDIYHPVHNVATPTLNDRKD